ncbi:hypothetical protein VB711_24840 [Cronbergia sp. UHCC 0137]|uniref:hypothetical protein n=1 Tax=Cronbergia sp. UHCC 0137 TaxID=3110239 RepID=UPI002B2002C7|nr:hypothetical protein [Cronbergia sp. UHCC 0137]MEA5621037.1 hypothetical protein [Cronbergia sp. UHCC 0137]
MKLANPLDYPIAVLVGGISLVLGVRLLQMPNIVMLPVAAGITVAGAGFLKSREPESWELDNPELEREIIAVKTSALALANKSNDLRLVARNLLVDSFQMDLLAAVQMSCDRASEVPTKIDSLALRLQSSNSLLSINELRQQLKEVQQKLKASGGVAKQHFNQLAESLQRNIKLAQEGEDIRLAQVVNLSTQIQDFTGILQQLQTKLHNSDLTDSQVIYDLQSLANDMVSVQESVYILVSK